MHDASWTATNRKYSPKPKSPTPRSVSAPRASSRTTTTTKTSSTSTTTSSMHATTSMMNTSSPAGVLADFGGGIGIGGGYGYAGPTTGTGAPPPASSTSRVSWPPRLSELLRDDGDGDGYGYRHDPKEDRRHPKQAHARSPPLGRRGSSVASSNVTGSGSSFPPPPHLPPPRRQLLRRGGSVASNITGSGPCPSPPQQQPLWQSMIGKSMRRLSVDVEPTDPFPSSSVHAYQDAFKETKRENPTALTGALHQMTLARIAQIRASGERIERIEREERERLAEEERIRNRTLAEKYVDKWVGKIKSKGSEETTAVTNNRESSQQHQQQTTTTAAMNDSAHSMGSLAHSMGNASQQTAGTETSIFLQLMPLKGGLAGSMLRRQSPTDLSIPSRRASQDSSTGVASNATIGGSAHSFPSEAGSNNNNNENFAPRRRKSVDSDDATTCEEYWAAGLGPGANDMFLRRNSSAYPLTAGSISGIFSDDVSMLSGLIGQMDDAGSGRKEGGVVMGSLLFSEKVVNDDDDDQDGDGDRDNHNDDDGDEDDDDVDKECSSVKTEEGIAGDDSTTSYYPATDSGLIVDFLGCRSKSWSAEEEEEDDDDDDETVRYGDDGLIVGFRNRRRSTHPSYHRSRSV